MNVLARVDLAASTEYPSATSVVFCPGFHSNKEGNKALHFEHWCRSQGLGYCRFDYRGHGDSPGDVAYCDLHDWLDDTLSIIDSLTGPVILVGSSMGAWLATLAAARRPRRIVALLGLAAAADFTTDLLWPSLSGAEQHAIEGGDTVRIDNAYDAEPWPLRQALFDSGKALSVLADSSAALASLRCPVSLIHGTNDTHVPWQQSLKLLQAIPHDHVTLTLIKGGDHRLSDTASLNSVTAALEALFARIEPT